MDNDNVIEKKEQEEKDKKKEVFRLEPNGGRNLKRRHRKK